MSASVYNQMLMSDLTILRTATATEVRKSPSPRALAKARRNLFGPVDHEFNRRFVAEELAKQQALAAEKWSFDFVSEKPLLGRYKWERFGAKTPKKQDTIISTRNLQEVPTVTTSTPVQVETEEQPTLRPERVQTGEITPPSQIQKTDEVNSLSKSSTRQPKITNYMKHCKRSFSGKKVDESMVKKRRLTPSATSS